MTIYDVRLGIVQSVVLVSPRDHSSTPLRRTFIVYKDGLRPRASGEYPALWKGRGAGGTDEGDWTVEAKGRLPDDTQLRPSTLDG